MLQTQPEVLFHPLHGLDRDGVRSFSAIPEDLKQFVRMSDFFISCFDRSQGFYGDLDQIFFEVAKSFAIVLLFQFIQGIAGQNAVDIHQVADSRFVFYIKFNNTL